jgi:hypothetical protein
VSIILRQEVSGHEQVGVKAIEASGRHGSCR